MSWYRKGQPGVKVRDLVAHLLKGDQDAEVMVPDHFGQPFGMNLDDFQFVQCRQDSTGKHTEWYLSISPVDIGPDPE